MAGTWRQFLFFFLLFYICAACLQLYSLFYPERCTSGDSGRISSRGCYTPLFGSGDALDLYVYASAKHDDGFDEWSLIYNATRLNTSAEHIEVVNVSLPAATRQNGSLHAHAILVKSGTPPDPNRHPTLPDSATQYRHKVTRHDWLSASTPLTRYMPRIGRNRSMLVGSSLEKEQSGAETDTSSDKQQASDSNGAVSQHMPADTLQVIGGLSLLSGLASLLPIDPATAVARYGGLIAVAVASEQYRRDLNALALQREQEAAIQQQRRVKEEATALLERALFKPEVLPVTHWKPRLRLRYSVDDAWYPVRKGPPLLYSEMEAPFRQVTYRMYGLDKYAPEFYADDLAITRHHLEPLSTNLSAPDPPLQIEFFPTSRPHVQCLKTIEMALGAYMQIGITEQDLDDVKHMFSDMSIKVLGLTYLISMLHMLFDFLAFKNDIGFFKSRKDFTGLSTRSLATSCCCSLIIFLYLLDNEYTSRIVLFSVGSGTAVEAWKVKRITKGGWVWRYGLPWAVVGAATVPAAQIDSAQQRGLQDKYEAGGTDNLEELQDKHEADGAKSAGEKLTQEIDALGMYYLSVASYPLVAVWGLYSLLYYPHKSWWSWLINTLANGVYSFGFVMMTPQLFINYKLKSVAHLPWRAFMCDSSSLSSSRYKAFNTFIDDAFAMIIDMPTKHRVMTLRDDLVFFIYLYQRYLYPVDKKRANEFGRAYEEDEDEDASTSSEQRRVAAAKLMDDDSQLQDTSTLAEDETGGGTASIVQKKKQ